VSGLLALLSPVLPAQKPPLLTVKINNQAFTEVIRVTVSRDLQNIAGTFEVTLVDETRLKAALLSTIGLSSMNAAVKAGNPITILADGEPLLTGWIDRPFFRWNGGAVECHITGRDKTGDLVDCAALPSGPTEFHGVDLLHVAKQVCAPFGITVKADVDIGAPFDRLALHKHQTALVFLESAARQRSVLLVSDGTGGLLLTRGGSTRGPAPLAIGGNIQEVEVEFDWTERFSDFYVTQDTARKRAGGPALSSAMTPPTSATPPASSPAADSAAKSPAIGAMGHAKDPEITRWRPTVRLTRSQSGMSTVQEQAEWMCRVAKGMSDHVHFTVLEWRAGTGKLLWRPNQVVKVTEPYSAIAKDMLIAGVTFTFDETGRKTRLRMAGVTAYDRINEADRKGRRLPKAGSAKGVQAIGSAAPPAAGLDSTVTPFTAL
jgi:prophage tail gpP-like protein